MREFLSVRMGSTLYCCCIFYSVTSFPTALHFGEWGRLWWKKKELYVLLLLCPCTLLGTLNVFLQRPNFQTQNSLVSSVLLNPVNCMQNHENICICAFFQYTTQFKSQLSNDSMMKRSQIESVLNFNPEYTLTTFGLLCKICVIQSLVNLKTHINI